MKGSVCIREKQTKSGPRYYVTAKVGGRSKSCGGFGSKRDAGRKKRQVEVELADGTFGKTVEEISFKVFAEQWLEDYKPSVKVSTFIAYQYDNKKHLVPFFGKKLLSNITVKDVQSYVTLKLREGLSPRTVNKTLTVLRIMFKHAIIQGYIDKDPAMFVVRPKVPTVERDFLRPDEIEKLILNSPEDYRALFATAALTGARQGELLALRWGDLDLDDGVMHIIGGTVVGVSRLNAGITQTPSSFGSSVTAVLQ